MSDAGEEISERVLMMTMQELMRWSKEKLLHSVKLGADGLPSQSDQHSTYTVTDNNGLWDDVCAELKNAGVDYKVVNVDGSNPPVYTVAVPQSQIDKFESVLDKLITNRAAEQQLGDGQPVEPSLTYERADEAITVSDIEREQQDVISTLRQCGVDVDIQEGPVPGTAYVHLSCEDGQSIIPPLLRACEMSDVKPPVCFDVAFTQDAYDLVMPEAQEAGALCTETELDTQGMPYPDDGLRHVRVYSDDLEKFDAAMTKAHERAAEMHSPVQSEINNMRNDLARTLRDETLKVQGMADLELSKTNYELVSKYCERNGVLLVQDGSLANGKLAPSDGMVHAKVLLAQKDAFAQTMGEVVRDLDEDSPDRARIVEKAGKTTEKRMKDEELSRKPSMKDRAARANEASRETERSRQFAKDKNRDMER